MKKALLFIGMAMCATIAFAQTNNYAKPQKNQMHDQVQSFNLKEIALQNADYKASIFTKAPGDTLGQWHFDSQAQMAGIIYDTLGYVTAGMTASGEALPENGASHPSMRWRWIEDSSVVNRNNPLFSTPYPVLSGARWGMAQNLLYLCSDGGGFMLMSLQDNGNPPQAGTDERTAQRPHAFFALPAVPSDPTVDRVIDVAFFQIHAKFYDQSFIDYKVDGNWYAREINVDGVDANVNYWSSRYRRYVMPLSLATQSSIEIRIRYLGGIRSNAWGYFWGVDDVVIIAGGSNRWLADDEDYVAGAYGTVPQNMQLPLTWTSTLHNAGCNPISNVSVTASHIAQNGTVTPILTVPAANMPQGDATANYPVMINEQGLMVFDSIDYAGWFSHGGGYMAESPVAGFQYRCIPTSTIGRNRVTVTANADSNLTMEWDTVAYRVVGYSTIDDLSEYNTVEGYRWGHDNGIIAAGGVYQYGFTTDGVYITDSGNWGTAGYALTSRFTTGMNIPEDQNQQPWVLRGVELVTSPTLTVDDLDGAKIRPVTYVDVYDGSSVSFYTLDNGVNQVTVTLDGENVNNYMATGYSTAVGETYQAVSIFFPQQPELEPNTSYRLGYRLASACHFAVGTTRTSYLIGENSWRSYDSTANTALWRHQFWPNGYDITVDDPMGDNILWAGYYHDSYPMIRAIVGPREELDNAEVRVQCNEQDYYIEYNDSTYCGNTLAIPETSGPTFLIVPQGDGTAEAINMVLDSLYIDSVYVPLPDFDQGGESDDFVAVDYSTYDTIHNVWNSGEDSIFCNLERYYWRYTFRDIHGNHSISAHAHVGTFLPTGVNTVANNEPKMVLAPNPATSQVAISVNGISGMVNCSIIDMSGRVIYNNSINAETTSTIDLRNIPAGAYFVRITNDNMSKVEKLIVR